MKSAALAALLLLATATSVQARPAFLSEWQLYRFGAGPGGGAVCAYYSGYRRLGSYRSKAVFRRRACFPNRSQCFRWIYWAQSHFPIRELRKGCGS